VQSHDTAAVLSRPTMRARARPVFFAGSVARGTSICSQSGGMSVGRSQSLPRLVCWYCDVRETSHRLENGSQVGRKEVPSGDEQDHKLDGESVAQARLPIIIENRDPRSTATPPCYRECHCVSYPACLFSLSSPCRPCQPEYRLRRIGSC
jgi:hypothetical protein